MMQLKVFINRIIFFIFCIDKLFHAKWWSVRREWANGWCASRRTERHWFRPRATFTWGTGYQFRSHLSENTLCAEPVCEAAWVDCARRRSGWTARLLRRVRFFAIANGKNSIWLHLRYYGARLPLHVHTAQSDVWARRKRCLYWQHSRLLSLANGHPLLPLHSAQSRRHRTSRPFHSLYFVVQHLIEQTLRLRALHEQSTNACSLSLFSGLRNSRPSQRLLNEFIFS